MMAANILNIGHYNADDNKTAVVENKSNTRDASEGTDSAGSKDEVGTAMAKVRKATALTSGGKENPDLDAESDEERNMAAADDPWVGTARGVSRCMSSRLAVFT